MIKLYKSFVFFIVLIAMNIPAQAHLGSELYSLRSKKHSAIISSGADWAHLKSTAKQAINFTNYPNPAVSHTTIAYTLLAKSNVALRIIDLAGKQLVILVKQEQAAGKQEYYWDLSKNKITSGMYIIMLTVDNKTYSRKMIVQ